MAKRSFKLPPVWIHRFLGRFLWYRKWFIKQMWKVIAEDARQGIKNTKGDNE